MKRILIVIASMFCIAHLVSGDINWSFPPEIISSTGVNASNSRVAIDPNGNAVAAWVENGMVKSKFRIAGSNWGAISTLSGSSASNPSIAIDANGNSTAVWVETTGIKAATKPFNSAWSSAVALSLSNATNPTLAVDAVGNAVAAWARNTEIEVSIKLAGNNWQNRVVINSPGGDPAANPKVALGGVGSNEFVYIVWFSNGAEDIVYSASKRLTTGSWSSATALSAGSDQTAYPQIAVDGNGNATAVWFSYVQTGSVFSSLVVQTATRPLNGNWSAPVNLSDAGMRDPSTLFLKVAYDGSGNTIAIWSTSFDNETFDIQSSIRPVYGSWMTPKSLIANNLYASQADRSVASFGDALALYLFYNGAALQIQSSELDITNFMDSIWSVPLTLSTGSQNGFPAVASSWTGTTFNAVALWLNTNGGVNNVVTSYGTKTLVGPPSNLAVTQATNNFGVFNETYNQLTWQASSDPNAVGYLIYRNGVFLAQVAADVLELVDNNQIQNGPVTYGVASVDSLGSHSPIININYP